MTGEHYCEECGAPLDGHRIDAEVCGSAECRRERSRVRALLSAGKGDPPYRALDPYAARRQRRVKAAEAP